MHIFNPLHKHYSGKGLKNYSHSVSFCLILFHSISFCFIPILSQSNPQF